MHNPGVLAAETPVDDAELLRKRTMLLGKIGALSGLLVVLVQVFLALTIAGYADPFGPITLLLLAAVLAPAAAYVICRRPSCSPLLLRMLEGGAVTATATLYSATLLFFDVQHHFDRLALLALTFVAVLRATLVPSGVVRTLFITAAMAVPLVAFVGLAYRGYTPEVGDALGATHTPIVMAGWTIIWWSFTTFLATMVSGALTDLRRRHPH